MPPNPKPVRKPVGPMRRPVRVAKGRSPSRIPIILTTIGAIGLGGTGWWLVQNPLSKPAAETAPIVTETAAPAATEADATASESTTSEVAETTVKPKTTATAAAPAETKPDAEAAPEATTPEAAAAVSFERLLALDDMNATKKENLAWLEESLKLAIKFNQWEDYRDLLGRSLKAAAARSTDSAATVAGQYSGPALIRHAFISTVTEPALRSLLANDDTQDQVRWMLKTPAAMQAFLVQLSPKDDVKKAISVWADLFEQDSAARGDYMELAIAIALVFDRDLRTQSGKAIKAGERFAYFKANNEKGKLGAKIAKMTASELVWVVGVPVDPEEMEWALKEADFRQKSWGQAYGSIKYDMEKAVTGKNSYDSYTFAEIKKKGGICADQAYFSAWTACSQGIPAAIVSGDGARGPHAWMTWMADEGDWKFSGRFDGYPAGHCRNPQTGKDVSEEEFLRLSDKKAFDHGRMVKAHQALWLADVFAGEPARALVFLTESVKHAPKLPEPSMALLTFWMDNKATAEVEEWKVFLRDLRKDFLDSETLMKLATKAETEFVFARQDVAETMKNLKRETKKIDDSAGEGAGMAVDLGRLTASYRNQADLLKKSGDLEGIRTLYRRALSDHGDDAASFKALTKDFFSFIKDDADLAVKTCKDLESACRRYVGRGKGDWFDVTSQNSAWRTVADCYRKAGDEKKADSIVKDCDSREKAAKKKAI